MYLRNRFSFAGSSVPFAFLEGVLAKLSLDCVSIEFDAAVCLRFRLDAGVLGGALAPVSDLMAIGGARVLACSRQSIQLEDVGGNRQGCEDESFIDRALLGGWEAGGSQTPKFSPHQLI
jgi:hypothetical protein